MLNPLSPPTHPALARTLRAALVALAVVVSAAAATPLRAQQADIIRGQVTGPDGQPLENATVTATSIPNNVSKVARTDANGRFTITYPTGDGDYWLSYTAIGFAPRKFEVKRTADQDILIADARLSRAVMLDAVKIQAERNRPARNDNTADISGTERNLGNPAMSPDQLGNLAAAAAMLPGVQLIPGADGNPDQFSVFGLGGDQNNATLNGMGFGGSDLPRDAGVSQSLASTPYDVSRGGFSGAQYSIRTRSGSNFSSRGLSGVGIAPQLEWTDRAAQAAGQEYSYLSVGGSAGGPLQLDKSFYNLSYQFDGRYSDLQSLLGAGPLALRTAGVAPDSVARLRGVLGTLGVPTVVGGLPSTRVTDHGSLLGSFDFSPPTVNSGQSFNVTVNGSWNRLNSQTAQLTALPTYDGQRTSWNGGVQGRHTNYFGVGVLTETSVGLNHSSMWTAPYLRLPGGIVRVTSTLDDGSSAVNTLSFGGSPLQATSSTSTSFSAQNQLSWFSADNRHRIKLTSEFRDDAFQRDLTTNPLGNFSYNSLADIEAGTPASFRRQLAPRVSSGSQLIGGLSLGDSYRPSSDLQLQYGVRLDGNRFLSVPDANPDVVRTFGLRNDRVPSRVYASPRAGFSWTYGTAAQISVADGFLRGPRAVVRGGVGLFQNVPATQTIAPAMDATGLPAALQQLTCVGSAVPTPDWNSYLGDPLSIPTQCADSTTGGGVFSNSAPGVTLFDPSYAAPRSLRSNLQWSGAVFGNRFATTIDGTYSLNMNQSQGAFVDLNFNPVTRFTLPDEAGRPVFVQNTSIVPATGAIASQDARVSQNYSHVTDLRSDLRSMSRQLTVSLSPLSFSSTWSWRVSYVYANTRDLARGFSSTGGSPLEQAWGRSSFDSRHQVTMSLSYNFFNWFPTSFSGSFRSGTPYTPLIAGDINGDGYSNDRAFVFDPATAADPAVTSAMQRLLADGSPGARDCLARQVNRLAARNSCQGPWTMQSALNIGINPIKFRLPQRTSLSFSISNPIGAADLLLHGEKGQHGWGQTFFPDQTLLFVRGFDPATNRYKYDVNPRFGSTRVGQTISRTPVSLTAMFRLDIGYTRERQLLTQQLDRGRRNDVPRTPDQNLKAMFGNVTLNPMATILRQADTLKLTRRQADSLSMLNRMYTLKLDSIWTPVVRFLGALPANYDHDAAYDRYRQAREASVDILIGIAPNVQRLLTPAQYRLLPAFITSSLDTRYLASIRSGTAGNVGSGPLAGLAALGALGGAVQLGGGGGSQTVIIRQ